MFIDDLRSAIRERRYPNSLIQQSLVTNDLGCLGSGDAECSYQPHFIAPADRPKLYLAKRLNDVSLFWQRLDDVSLSKNPSTTEYPANGSPILGSTRVDREVSNLFRVREKNNGQASRLISTSQLNASRRFHIWPINLVVYQEPLGVLRLGRSHLVEGFTLRCIQRFSLPDVATRRCRWRDNRYTRGPSNPVLSY